MPAESLKSKLEGNQLDLSLSSLAVVPVKELATLPKATSLDLSCNLLTYLPDDFCTLTHLVKLDISKNQLTELPENFGYLVKLQHLDLYQNKLRALPVSFCRLNALKWLDIKDNQLEDETLVSAAGECLSDAQCRTCAKQVVVYMKKVQSDQERERQKRLATERAVAAARKAEEELEAQRKRAEKKAEKEERRLRALQRANDKAGDADVLEDDVSTQEQSSPEHHFDIKSSHSGGLSLVYIFFAVLLLAIAGVVFYCQSSDAAWCIAAQNCFQNYVRIATKYADELRKKFYPENSQEANI